ncbi:hypothetical protein KKC88_02520 [Patescibacteria group bacterium]|nr:hypothetical protein [Patescibacteria group bacterium]MBU1963343.1 hypothetical protein [Patescibacteria group bacterium]
MTRKNFTKQIIKYDTKDVLGSVDLLAEQCRHAWQEMKKVKLPADYKKIDKIVLFGMGGSALGIDVAKALYGNDIRVPIEIINDYAVPKYVNNYTLAILSSYSGSTEETVMAAKKLEKVTKKIFIITTGKNLLNLANRKKYPVYMIDPEFNPCGQPRVAVGYSVMAQIALLKKLGLIKFEDKDVEKIVKFLKSSMSRIEASAIKMAKLAKGKMPLWVAAEHLKGNAHIISNQTNETGKEFSTYFPVPEMNHHLMEGLSFPRHMKKDLLFVLFDADIYFKRNQVRMKITQEVILKNRVKAERMRVPGKTKPEQVFAMLAWGGYFSFYMAMINEIDPSLIPWVDYFKQKLGSSK